MIEIIELDNVATVRAHANLFDSAGAFLQRRFGNHYQTIYQDLDGGTVKVGNQYFDFWRDNNGKWVAYDAD